jgi:hypothetical protein
MGKTQRPSDFVAIHSESGMENKNPALYLQK